MFAILPHFCLQFNVEPSAYSYQLTACLRIFLKYFFLKLKAANCWLKADLMLCPECNHALKPISLTGKTGVITLDYCMRCGGVWSDQGEVNFLKKRDLGPLEHLLPKNATHPSIYTLPCPKDRTTLHITKGESIPTNVDIFRCDSCGGIWFPENTLINFKKAQEAKLTYFKTWNIPLQSIYAILLPLLFIAIVGGGLVATFTSNNVSTDNRTKAKDTISKPLVLYPKQDQALIHFTTSEPSIVKINYWITPAEVAEVWSSTTVKTQHTIMLSNLLINTTYSYQITITSPQTVTSSIYTFHTSSTTD